MPADHRVALEGFSTFERDALESFFRLAEQRTPSYGLAQSILDAHYIVADADDPDSVAAVIAAERVAETVFVGTNVPGNAMARLPRPVDPVRIVRELDALVALQSQAPTLSDVVPDDVLQPAQAPAAASRPAAGPAASAGTPPAPAASAASALPASRAAPSPDAARAMPMPPPASASPMASSAEAAARPPEPATPEPSAAAPKARAPVARATTPAAVLVVDDSDVAQRFFARLLEQIGLTPVLARNSEEALELLARRPFAFVLLDVVLGDDSELDGLLLAQQIKQRQRRPHTAPKADSASPRIVFVTALAQQSDRVRGSLAGGDAYLTKPVDEALLARTLADLMPSLFATPSSRGRPARPRR